MEERRDYLGTLLHALNQPLTAIANYLEGGRAHLSSDSDPFVREAVEAACGESRRAVLIARELTETLGRRAPDRAPAHELAPDLDAVARQLSSRVGLNVRLEADRSLDVVRGSSFAFRRSLELLASRALDAFGSGPEHDLHASLRSLPDEGGARVELRLEGKGLDPQAVERFARSCDGDPVAALALSALADHGGRVDLDAVEGPSLRIRIRLLSA